ncbi:PAS domain S-box-containing protein [Rhizobium sp. BK650]|uniref:LuxR C-terminal-related transcriptional regulator n=1 Tax=Rhizobium sp. BK650 TaxID=2586990 RepID=UPI00160DA4C2|nr:PAS domain S-box-containing protein [Rhizobium sp. BK650]
MSIKFEAPQVSEYGPAISNLGGRASFAGSRVARCEPARGARQEDGGLEMGLVQQLYQRMPDAIFLLNERRGISACNRAAVSLFGYEESELLGHKLDFVWSSTPGVHLKGRWADQGSMRAGMAITKSGAQFPVALTIIREHGETAASAAAIVEDFRAGHEALQQVQELQDELARLVGMVALGEVKARAPDIPERPLRDQTLVAAVNGAMRQRRYAADFEGVAERLHQLTDRERQVLSGVLDGLQNKMIAYHLGISCRTVEVHRANVMAKMGARNLAELMRMAMTTDATVQPLETKKSLPVGGSAIYIR